MDNFNCWPDKSNNRKLGRTEIRPTSDFWYISDRNKCRPLFPFYDCSPHQLNDLDSRFASLYSLFRISTQASLDTPRALLRKVILFICLLNDSAALVSVINNRRKVLCKTVTGEDITRRLNNWIFYVPQSRIYGLLRDIEWI